MHQVSLCHASVGEFLQTGKMHKAREYEYDPRMEDFLLKREESNLLIAQTCLAYLFCYNVPGADDHEFPLLNYAWFRWETHIAADDASELQIDYDSSIQNKAIFLYDSLRSVLLTRELCHRDSSAGIIEWLRDGSKDRLLDALNTPYFYPEFGAFCPTPRNEHVNHSAMDSGAYSTCPRPPLEPGRPSIRVLEMLPCLDAKTTIRCRLHVVDLDTKPHYYAVFHDSGPKEYEDIASVDGKPTLLLPSQARVLGPLRSRYEASIPSIWIDGICSNKDDK